jgi:hypothetical protein
MSYFNRIFFYRGLKATNPKALQNLFEKKKIPNKNSSQVASTLKLTIVINITKTIKGHPIFITSFLEF